MANGEDEMNVIQFAEAVGVDYQPTVAMRDETVVVQLPANGQRVVFTFAEIDAGRKSFDCELIVTIPGTEDEFSGHLNGASLSNRDQFRLALDKVFGAKEYGWTKLLAKAYQMARTEYLAASIAIDIEDVPLDFTRKYRMEGCIPHEGVVIPFGMGDSAKTYVVLSMCMALGTGADWLGKPSHPSTMLYLDYEATDGEHRRRWHRLGLAAEHPPRGTFHYMPARGISFVEQAQTIRRELTRTDSDLLIVDSAVAACGGDPLKPEPVRAMFNALNALRVPVILIAHTTKENGGDTPFGTVFWHNFARMTWFIQKASSEDSPDIQVALINRKANNDRRQKTFGVEVRFTDPEGGVSVSPCEPRRVQSLRSRMDVGQQVLGCIEESGPMDVDDLVEATGLKEKSIYNAANRLVKRKVLSQQTEPGKPRRWALRSEREVEG